MPRVDHDVQPPKWWEDASDDPAVLQELALQQMHEVLDDPLTDAETRLEVWKIAQRIKPVVSNRDGLEEEYGRMLEAVAGEGAVEGAE